MLSLTKFLTLALLVGSSQAKQGDQIQPISLAEVSAFQTKNSSKIDAAKAKAKEHRDKHKADHPQISNTTTATTAGTSKSGLTCSTNTDRIKAEANTADWEAYHGKGKLYEDASFPADITSLYWEEYMDASDQKYITTYEKVAAWKRPSEIEKSPSLWGSKGIGPQAVVQGKLGDCWFLAAAAALAEHKERIEKIFVNTEYPVQDGIFQVRLYNRGTQFLETIDDRIPMKYNVKDSTYAPINSDSGPNGSWWLVMLEKAYAKMNVNYVQLSGGQPDQTFRDLTGMPTDAHKTNKDPEIFFKNVQEADQKQWIMTAACLKSHYGLIRMHAYTLVGVVDLKKDGVSHQKLVKLRNPWGQEMYEGPWKDDDELWTADFKKQANLTVADDGVFHMPYDKFMDSFPSWQVAMYQDWKHTAHPEKGTAKDYHGQATYHQYFVTSSVDQEVVVTIDFQNERQLPSGCKQPKHQYNIIINDEGEGRKMLAQKGVNRRHGYGAATLQMKAGDKYKVRIFDFQSGADAPSDFVIHTYGASAAVPVET